ncbi:MAG: DEAD/DEAH box helicase [Piscirickettsiaceae bacterium]|nr:DEAD/DEAH box helicase [Piscirickettsiaceae bacterium]
MSFSSLGLSDPLLRAVEAKGYTEPSPIQLEAIPAVLTGSDVMAAAQTGTGKTASFTLPLLQLLDNDTRVRPNHIRALILTPTRELAAQVHDSVVLYGQGLSLRSAVVFGGVKINPQMMKLRRGVDILVATPGRLMDLYNQNAVKFSDVEILILDEADRMLDMGFIRDIRKIMSYMPKTRQNLLFSATFSGEIRTLAQGLLKNPVQIEISPQKTTAEGIKQSMFEVDKTKKTELLIHLIGTNNWNQVLVFMRTKHGCNRLVKKLEQFGISAAAIHGNKSQGARTRALADFKQNKIRVLVATDIAARGIDISDLPHVINFELPNVPEDYVHRIGRTGRAGAEGEAISLVSSDEVEFLADIENLIRQTLVRDVEVGFVPVHSVPITKLGSANSKKGKKARRPSQDGGQRKEPTQQRGENRPRRSGNSSAKFSGQRRSGNNS